MDHPSFCEVSAVYEELRSVARLNRIERKRHIHLTQLLHPSNCPCGKVELHIWDNLTKAISDFKGCLVFTPDRYIAPTEVAREALYEYLCSGGGLPRRRKTISRKILGQMWSEVTFRQSRESYLLMPFAMHLLTRHNEDQGNDNQAGEQAA